MRVCVFTAVYGGYDELREQPIQTIPADFICFTDSPKLSSTKTWTVIPNHLRPDLHPRLRAKYFKVLSHRIFPQGRPSLRETGAFGLPRQLRPYDYLIWIDASAVITTPRFIERIIGNIYQSGWTLFRHPDRDCIYEEVRCSLAMLKYQGLPLRQQVRKYRWEGYPAHHGLMACGVIGRDARRPDIGEINEQWWYENLLWSYQDQLSFPVVLWRAGKSCDLIQESLWANPFVTWRPHNSEY